jgi:hypothetical protein
LRKIIYFLFLILIERKLIKSKIPFPVEYGDLIGPIFLCFGNLPYNKRTVMRVPEEEEKLIEGLKSDTKKKQKRVEKKK